MAKVTVEDLKRIREETARKIIMRTEKGRVRILVHTGSCGIAAGARGLMTTLLEEKAKSGRDDIYIIAAGCSGSCEGEPNITVEIADQPPMVYEKMDDGKIRKIFKDEILTGQLKTGVAQTGM